MKKSMFISAFSKGEMYGGEVITHRLTSKIFPKCDDYLYRQKNFFIKFFFLIIGIILAPFIHPIFSRYMPINLLSTKRKSFILNFSQSFAIACYKKDTTLICHDLQCHRNHFFKKWVRASEKFLLERAKYIYTLSNRDKRIIRLLYKIPSSKIHNAFPMLYPELTTYSVKLDEINKVVFVGSLKRKENYEAIKWFQQKVMPNINIRLTIFGSSAHRLINDERISFAPHVEDLTSELKKYDIAIAPMLTKQGIKIKVVDYLMARLPVLSTRNGVSGIEGFPSNFLHDNEQKWVNTFQNGGIFIYKSHN